MAEDPSLDYPEELEDPKYFVRVTGFSTNTTRDALLNFFENTRRSGGGDIRDIQLNSDEGFTDIIFCSNNDAEQVVKKKGLQLDGAILTTTLKPIPKELPKDHKRLHVMGISDKTIRDGLVAFMEVMSGKEIESILFGDNCNGVVSFVEPIDFDELQRICKTSSLDNSFLNVEQVIVCDSIEVSGFTENTTKDTIMYYFRNNRNGGGDVKSIEIIAEGRVLLTFEDPRVVDSLLKQVHVIDGVHLVISRYYPFLGETSLKNPKGEKRGEKAVQVDPQTMMFIEEFYHEEFNQLLQESRVKYTWQQGSGEILLGCAEPKMDKKTWENSCEAVVSYVNQFVTDKISISQEIWEEMSDEVTGKCVGLETQIQILHVFDFSKKQDSIIFRGKKTDVCAVLKELHDSVSRVEKQIMFEKSKVTKKIDLSEAQMELMSLCGFIEDLKSKDEDLEIVIDSGDHTIQMRGQEDVVNEGNLTVWQTLAELKETDLKLDKSVIEILASEEGKAFLSTMLKNNNIDAVVCPDSNLTEMDLVVTAVDRNNMKKALSLIHDVTAEEIFPLDVDQKQLLDSEEWRELKDSIQQSMLLKITQDSAKNKLLFVGVKQEIDNAKERIEEFFKNNTIMENVEAEAESAVLNDINELSMKKEPTKVLEESDEEEGDSGKWILYGTDIDTDTNPDMYGTDIDTDTNPDMYGTDIDTDTIPVDSDEILSDGNEDRLKVEGKPEGGNILSAQDELLMHRDSVAIGDNLNSTKEEQCPEAVTMPSDSFDIKDLQENDFFQLDAKVTQRTEELSVVNEGKEDEAPPIPMSNSKSQSVMLPLSKTLDSGVVVVSVHQGDITKVQVDVIVNSANECLSHGGGVAGAIVKQGGRQIQQESDALVRKYGRFSVGLVAHTGPGNLPYKRIFHAVGPQWRVHGEERSRKFIFDACMNSFNLASKNKTSSIALPGISSGIYGVPKQICAEMMFTAAESFAAEASSDNQLKDIRFVNIDNSTYEAFRREFHNRYGLMKGEDLDVGSNSYQENADHSYDTEIEKEREYRRDAYQKRFGSTAGTGKVDTVEEPERKKRANAAARSMEQDKENKTVEDGEKTREHKTVSKNVQSENKPNFKDGYEKRVNERSRGKKAVGEQHLSNKDTPTGKDREIGKKEVKEKEKIKSREEKKKKEKEKEKKDKDQEEKTKNSRDKKAVGEEQNNRIWSEQGRGRWEYTGTKIKREDRET